MKLFYRQSGEGRPLIILHGLFGSSDNWYTLAKVFSQTYRVYLVDQRNHGQSPHSSEFNYKLLTEDLSDFIQQHGIDRPVIMGHSMGGKTAMNFAVKYPEQLSTLIVVDIVPKKYPVHHDHILEGLMAIPLEKIQTRGEAEKILAEFVDEPEVRQFLLKNLSRDANGGFYWKVNLTSINTHIEELGEGMQYGGTFNGSTLFVKGSRSNYFEPGDESRIQEFFPKAKLITLNTGHWVQAEQPEEFSKVVLEFLRG